jgi:hypothetical protein
MNLQLFLGTTLVGHVPIDPEAAINPTYLSQKKLMLEEAYKDEIQQSKSKPTFCIAARSSANERRGSMSKSLIK